MVSGEQGRGPGVGKAPSQRCMSDLVVTIGRGRGGSWLAQEILLGDKVRATEESEGPKYGLLVCMF